MINPTGYTALDLVGFTDKGTYASNVNYVKNDIVHYGGNLWRCKIDDTTNVTPAEGNNWTLFVGEPTNLVERIIAPLEENPATVAYAAGRQIIYDDWLWEVIDDIAVGDPLIDYAVDPTNANIKKASPVETQLLEEKAKVGNLASLLTSAKTSLVAAINEVVGNIGSLSSLATTIKTSLVGAINEVVGNIGSLSSLATTIKTSLVGAINEVDAHADTASDKADIVQAQVSNSGDAFDPTRPYKVGEYCIHEDVLYRCITACSAGSWATNQSCFAETTLTTACDNLNAKLGGLDIVKVGYISVNGDNITANSQFTFTISDTNIRASDKIIATLRLSGSDTGGVSVPRCTCENGFANIVFLTSRTYNTITIVGFFYIIFR